MLKIIVLHYNIAIFYYIQIIILIKKKSHDPTCKLTKKKTQSKLSLSSRLDSFTLLPQIN